MGYKIVSWNVDGYQPAKHQFLINYIKEHHPDIIFLSETKSKLERLEGQISTIKGYRAIYNVHFPANYHGVAALIKKGIRVKKLNVKMNRWIMIEDKPVSINTDCRRDSRGGDPAIGRIIALEIDQKFNFVGVYTPNSGGGYTDKHDYRVEEWDPSFRRLAARLNKKLPTIITGDLNIAPAILDVSSDREMTGWAGYKPEEQQQFRKLLRQGWVDIWRRDHSDIKEFSWVGYSKRAHTGKYGMRLDHMMASTSLAENISNCQILPETVSDHRMIICTVNKD